MAKAGRTWEEKHFGFMAKVRYYYPNSPSKKGRYKQVLTQKGWSRI